MNQPLKMPHPNPEFPTLDRATAINRVLNSLLDQIVHKLKTPFDGDDARCVAIASFALNEGGFVRPLSRNELYVLAAAIVTAETGRPMTYADVAELTDRHSNKRMVVTAIYDALDSLVKRKFLAFAGEFKRPDSDRVTRKSYRITDTGREAFRIALLNAYGLTQLDGSEAQDRVVEFQQRAAQ